MQLRHAHHKFLSKLIEIYHSGKLVKDDVDPKTLRTIGVLLDRSIDMSRSINILLEANLPEDASIIARTLYETTMRLSFITKDIELSNKRTAIYLSDMEYKEKVLGDIRELKFTDINIEDAEDIVNREKNAILELLGWDEKELKERRNMKKMSEDLNISQAYSIYYRYFSQYVHSKSMIFEMYESNRRDFLHDEVLACCCLCWIIIIDHLNHFFDLGKTKDIRNMHKDYKTALKFNDRKWGK